MIARRRWFSYRDPLKSPGLCVSHDAPEGSAKHASVRRIAIDAAEFAPACFDKHKVHRLTTIWTCWGRRVLWHVYSPAGQAGAQHSQSPIAADGGAVIG